MEQRVQDEVASSVLGKGHIEADARNVTQNDNGASQFDDTISEVQSRHRALKGPSHLDNQFALSVNLASPVERNRSANANAHRHNANLLGNDLRDRAPPPSESGVSELSQWTFCSIQPVIDRGNAVHMTWEQTQPEKHGHSTPSPPSQAMPDIEISRLDDGHMEPLDSPHHTKGGTMEPFDDNEDAKGVTMESADGSEDVDSIENRICSSLVPSAFDAREYLPLDQLCKILSPCVVHHLLVQHFGDAKALEYEREVIGTQDGTPVSPPRRRRILAILVLIKQVKRLPKFIEHGVDDTALPFHFAHIKPARVDQQPVCLAVKRLHTPNVNDYLQEIDLFDKLGAKIKDPLAEHLIPLQLTFKHGKDYFLMFPWADGNLKKLWRKQTANPEDPKQVHHISTRVSPKKVTPDNVKEMILGVKEWGRHGDIKPENILWFKHYNNKQNHLVISDFGLTQFNSAHSRSKVHQGQILGFSGTYRPPDLHIEDQPISQNYDVWSLGCVFLEFVSWFLLGHDETVFNFAKARLRDEPEGTIGEDTFFVFEDGYHGKLRKAKLKDSVVEWITELHKMSHCSEPLHALLDLIQFTMLVPNSKERWKSDFLYIELQALESECKESGFDIRGTPGKPNSQRYLHQPQKPQTVCTPIQAHKLQD
ncbi:hypothetical protein CEP54_012337 [Fusarium duplospermum]|uniref:Protein kinase domain-containing protein n=1 Tax=Fusarium duplospermum TaxID=1325734 RepID=A0A428P9B5_9HYPO|nr:hypothetical protein CEP54_012337 [Fusarium duplospermum]